jgi:hypothetical protein
MDSVIWDNGFNHRRSKHFVEEAGSEYDDALYYTLVRWLSWRAVLDRLHHLRNGIDIFMTEQGKTVQQLSDEKWGHGSRI